MVCSAKHQSIDHQIESEVEIDIHKGVFEAICIQSWFTNGSWD